VLTRDYIFEALYCPKNGYFGKKGSEVIISPEDKDRINFRKLKGFYDYQQELGR